MIMKNIIVVGGGAAGMMAAAVASEQGCKITLIEKNEKLGKKLFITGKGRCNITNACASDVFFDNIVSNPKFLFSSFKKFSNADVVSFFENAGLPTVVERGERIFPASSKSSDVTKVLENILKRNQVNILKNTRVKSLIIKDSVCLGVITQNNEEFRADAVIIATGGQSYPATGSSGDGYGFARQSGHTVTEVLPGLVPMNVAEDWVKELQGLSLKNVSVRLESENKKHIFNGFGEMLFTHFGVSGPLILEASSYGAKELKSGVCRLFIDLKPALDDAKLDMRLLREIDKSPKKSFKNLLADMLPSKMLPVFVKLSGISAEKRACEISGAERKIIRDLFKDLGITITGVRNFEEAIITKGGVSVKEINPSSMESKKVNGLFFTGELLDTDGVTGGFNLQIAWSTGYAAGLAASKEV